MSFLCGRATWGSALSAAKAVPGRVMLRQFTITPDKSRMIM
jgi:hypothetical protein